MLYIYKKSHVCITYPWAKLPHSCLVEDVGYLEHMKPLWSCGQLFTSDSNPKQHKNLKGTHLKVLLISSSRHHPASRPPWSYLRQPWSLGQAGWVPCSPAPTSFVFPALELLPPCGVIILWLVGLPIIHCLVTTTAELAPIHHQGLSGDFLILYWMDFWII